MTMQATNAREVSAGSKIRADWANRIVRQLSEQRLSAGDAIRITRTPAGGTVVSVDRDALHNQRGRTLSGGCAAQGGGETGLGFVVAATLYADGFGSASTGTAKVFVLELNVGGYFPEGSRFWASSGNGRVTGGEEA